MKYLLNRRVVMKEKIALVTDSTCDLPQQTLDNSIISCLPLKIIYGDKEYRDRLDIKPGEIYDKIEDKIPTTSMPGPDDIQKELLKLKDRGFTHVLAIHISSGLSSTYEISNMVGKQIEGLTVEVIDSKLISMGLGRLVLYAKELIEARKFDFNEIVNKVRAKINDVELYFVVKTLKYLIHGGRIGKVKGTIGELLNLKPIISMDSEGEYYTFKKVRSRKRSLGQLFKIVREKIKEGICYVDVMHANAEQEARELLDKIKKNWKMLRIHILVK